MRAIVILTALAACDAQVDADYPGEPIAEVSGSVQSPGDPLDAEVALLWWSPVGTALRSPARVTGAFPSGFQLQVFEPPPAAALAARAAAVAVVARREPAASALCALPAPTAGEPAVAIADIAAVDPTTGAVRGLERHHVFVYAAQDVPADAPLARALGGPLRAGYQLRRIEPTAARAAVECSRCGTRGHWQLTAADEGARLRIEMSSAVASPCPELR